MSRCTPGPWSPDNTGIHGYRVLANDERRTIVCEVTGSVSNTRSRADAHLIAAAPGLLAALERLYEDAMPRRSAAMEDALAMAEDAIAKAKGETP